MSKKSTRALASATLMSLVLTTALSGAPVKAASGSVTRLGAGDRYATAAKVATTNWDKGSKEVVLVCGEGYADAVSASVLAKTINAPILLTTSKSLSTEAKAALETLKAEKVYVVGGDASVSQSVRSDLKGKYSLVELQGKNRYETNVAVANELVKNHGIKADNVILVGGEGFSDALSVAPIAASKGQILLLGNNSEDSMKSVAEFVKANSAKVKVVGTKNVINENIMKMLGTTDRVDGGSNRFDTNLKVLAEFKSELKMDKLFVANATGEGYADALVASALAGKTSSPLVLVDTEGSSDTSKAVSYIKDNATKTTDLNVVGGTGVVSEGTVDAINKAVGNVNPNNNTTVKSVEVVSLNQVKVHFNCNIDSDSAEAIENYKIDGTQLTELDENGKAKDENGAKAVAIDDNTVMITLAHPRKQSEDVTVSVKKAVLTKDTEATIDAIDVPVTFKDTTLPTLKAVTVEGNSQLTVEFSEAVNMKTIQDLKSKFKIDGKSISNYSINNQYSEIKDSVEVDNSSFGPKAVWANKVMFYFDSTIDSGNHTLKIEEGDKDGVLMDAAALPFKEDSREFTVDSLTTKPVIKSVKEVSSGEVHITFDRSMDVQTAKDKSNYKINDTQLSKISGVEIKTTDDDKVIKLKHVSSAIKTGSNTVDVKDTIKDAYGNKVATDTREHFDDVKDETKPTIKLAEIIDSETIRVKFSKDVDYTYAHNVSNYKLEDNKNIDITNHIRGIYSTVGESDKENTSTYNIKLTKFNPSDSNDDWRLTGSKYTLTIKNIVDTASKPNPMDEWSKVLNGSDTINPKATGIYYKKPVSGERDKVVIYFTESMDSSTLTNKDNFKFVNGEGDTKSLPSDTNITSGGDNKSAILEFPSSYHVKTTGKTTSGTTNDVTAVRVSNVKDEAGNLLDTVSFDNNGKIDIAKAGAKVKENTLKVKYDGDDLKAEVQFDKAVDEAYAEDFTLGGVHPSSVRPDGDKVILTFKEDWKVDKNDTVSTVTYANKLVNKDLTKIEAVKSQGQDAKLAIIATKTIDETGAKISTDDNGASKDLTDTQAKVYDYEAGPRTTCSDKSDADFWTATKDNDGGKVYVTFDTILDDHSGLKSDDLTFTAGGTEIKADTFKVEGNTVVFNFNKNNKDFASFDGNLDIRIKPGISLRTTKDVDGNHASYVPSTDDLKKRTITITGKTDPTDKPVVTVKDGGIMPGQKTVTVKLPADLNADDYTVKVEGNEATIKTQADGTKVFMAVYATSSDEATIKNSVVYTKKATSAVVKPATVTVKDGGIMPGQKTVTVTLPTDVNADDYTVKVEGNDATLKTQADGTKIFMAVYATNSDEATIKAAVVVAHK